MSEPVRILGIAGSLRRASYDRAALRATVQLMPEGGTIEPPKLDGIPSFIGTRSKTHPQKSWI